MELSKLNLPQGLNKVVQNYNEKIYLLINKCFSCQVCMLVETVNCQSKSYLRVGLEVVEMIIKSEAVSD